MTARKQQKSTDKFSTLVLGENFKTFGQLSREDLQSAHDFKFFLALKGW